ncbi:NADPH-dependent FMN reductase [Patescibacteria group bacterium]
MANNKLFIPILLGTVRQGRESEKVANWVLRWAEEDARFDTQLMDVRNMDLPMDDEGEALKEKNPEYKAMIEKADGLIIVSPEYNRGYPGSLKRAIDVLLDEYNHRAVGIVGVSSGGFGGARMIEHLLPVLRTFGMVTIWRDLNFTNVGEVFDGYGNPITKEYEDRIRGFFDELVWMSQVLRDGRDNYK